MSLSYDITTEQVNKEAKHLCISFPVSRNNQLFLHNLYLHNGILRNFYNASIGC